MFKGRSGDSGVGVGCIVVVVAVVVDLNKCEMKFVIHMGKVAASILLRTYFLWWLFLSQSCFSKESGINRGLVEKRLNAKRN